MLGLNLTILEDGRKAIIIRTSDRIAFKQCRRKWAFSSHLKRNLGSKQLAAPLWFGSAIHFALEDYHGWNKFGHPKEAFKAYCIATSKNYLRDLPSDAQEHFQLGQAMMDYYVDYWLGSYGRKPDETYWAPNPETGVLEPQVEVNFEIPIPIDDHPILRAFCDRMGVDVVLYRGTIDRVCIDSDGFLWVDEYKTAKVAATMHYSTDPQVTTYVWAAGVIYDKPVAGVIYHQFVKKSPNPPPLLSTGKISTAANLVSSWPLYREALEGLYESIAKAPAKNQEKLNELAKSETEDRDRYIVRDRIFRNSTQCQSEAFKILLEQEDMLNPDLPLYPNPTRDCSRMCSFLSPCIGMDDGSDWEALLDMQYASRDQDADRLWRRRLPSPASLWEAQNKDFDWDLESIQLEAKFTRVAKENILSDEDQKLAEIDAGDYPAAEWDIPADLPKPDEQGRYNLAEVST